MSLRSCSNVRSAPTVTARRARRRRGARPRRRQSARAARPSGRGGGRAPAPARCAGRRTWRSPAPRASAPSPAPRPAARAPSSAPAPGAASLAPMMRKPRGLPRSLATLASILLGAEPDRHGDADAPLDQQRQPCQRARRRLALHRLATNRDRLRRSTPAPRPAQPAPSARGCGATRGGISPCRAGSRSRPGRAASHAPSPSPSARRSAARRSSTSAPRRARCRRRSPAGRRARAGRASRRWRRTRRNRHARWRGWRAPHARGCAPEPQAGHVSLACGIASSRRPQSRQSRVGAPITRRVFR